jgi:hypothetical protein
MQVIKTKKQDKNCKKSRAAVAARGIGNAFSFDAKGAKEKAWQKENTV